MRIRLSPRETHREDRRNRRDPERRRDSDEPRLARGRNTEQGRPALLTQSVAVGNKPTNGKKNSAENCDTNATQAGLRHTVAAITMPYGFLCCGPGVENNVHYSSDDDSSSGEDGFDEVNVDVIRWPSQRLPPGQASPSDVPLTPTGSNPSVLPSKKKMGSELRKMGRSGPVTSSSPGDGTMFERLADSWKGMQVSLVSKLCA